MTLKYAADARKIRNQPNLTKKVGLVLKCDARSFFLVHNVQIINAPLCDTPSLQVTDKQQVQMLQQRLVRMALSAALGDDQQGRAVSVLQKLQPAAVWDVMKQLASMSPEGQVRGMLHQLVTPPRSFWTPCNELGWTCVVCVRRASTATRWTWKRHASTTMRGL